MCVCSRLANVEAALLVKNGGELLFAVSGSSIMIVVLTGSRSTLDFQAHGSSIDLQKTRILRIVDSVSTALAPGIPVHHTNRRLSASQLLQTRS